MRQILLCFPLLRLWTLLLNIDKWYQNPDKAATAPARTAAPAAQTVESIVKTLYDTIKRKLERKNHEDSNM